MRIPSGQSQKDDKKKTRKEQAEEVGKLLRSAREKQKRTISDITIATGVPGSEISALEHGQLDLFPSQLAVLACLRKVSNYLKLNGDQLAIKLLDSWMAEDPTEYLPTQSAGTTQQPNNSELVRSTTEIPTVASSFPQKPAKRKRTRRRRRTPLGLVVFVWVLIFLNIFGLIALDLEHTHPSLFKAIHAPTTLPTTVPVTAPPTTALRPLFQLVGTQNGATIYEVYESSFNLRITTTAQCWFEVTSQNSQTPLFQDVLNPGDQKVFQNLTQVTVVVGAAGSTLQIFNGFTQIGSVNPSAAGAKYEFETPTQTGTNS